MAGGPKQSLGILQDDHRVNLDLAASISLLPVGVKVNLCLDNMNGAKREFTAPTGTKNVPQLERGQNPRSMEKRVSGLLSCMWSL